MIYIMSIVCFYVQLDNKYNKYSEDELLFDNHQFKSFSVFNMCVKVDTSCRHGDWERNEFSADI